MKIDIEGANAGLETDASVPGISLVSYKKFDEDSMDSGRIVIDDRRRLVSTKSTAGYPKKRCRRCCCYCFLATLFIIVLIAVAFAVLIFFIMPPYLSAKLFGNNVHDSNYNNFTLVNSTTRNFYLQKDLTLLQNPKDGGENWPSIGIWHVLPNSVAEKLNGQNLSDTDFESALGSGDEKVVLYLHGNGRDRIARAGYYNVISGLNFHVLALDYRGFGDSTGKTTIDGMHEDVSTLYKYAKSKAPDKEVIIWAHSMGTGVANRFVAELSDQNTPPRAMILSAPFNNLHDLMNYTAYTEDNPFLKVPFFDFFLNISIAASNLHMDSDKNIARVKCPIFVMHAEDDVIIPTPLTLKLVEAARAANRTITYHNFPPELKLGHRSVQLAKDVPQLISEFLEVNKPATDD